MFWVLFECASLTNALITWGKKASMVPLCHSRFYFVNKKLEATVSVIKSCLSFGLLDDYLPYTNVGEREDLTCVAFVFFYKLNS